MNPGKKKTVANQTQNEKPNLNPKGIAKIFGPLPSEKKKFQGAEADSDRVRIPFGQLLI